MPSWKKVIISGSAAELSSLIAPSITGSLRGTASFATTASTLTPNTNAFIQGGNSFGTTALLGTNDNQNLNIETSGSVRMTVSSSGNVGIGTTTPTTKLEVNGDFKFGPYGGGVLTFGSYQYGTDFDMSPITGPGGWARAHRIKTSDPSGSIFFGVYGNATTLDRAYWTIDTPESLTFNSKTNGIHLLKNGNVGIGTYVPSASLHITNTSTSASFLVEDSANPDTTPFVINNLGEVGIGTLTPTVKLELNTNAGGFKMVGTDHIYQQFYPSGLSAGRFGYIGYGFSGSTQLNITNEVAGGNLTLGTAGNANRLFISASGNVGIGTSTPLASLHTTGSAIISGSMVIGSSSLGPSENTLTLGARDSVQEGGQLGFNASGGTYTSASFIDLYQNRLRILKGTNATSTGEVANWNMHNLQMALPAYSSVSSFPGTAAGYLAFDAGGNVITVAAGNPFPFTGSAQITGSLVITGSLSVSAGITGSLFGTASFARTASFVTGSNVFGPFGANSITSASFAVSASRALTSSFSSTATSASYAATSSFSLAATANQLLVINKSGATIAKGVVVHLTGSTNSSDTPYITTASYESDSLSANSLGITAESIAFNSTGFVTTEGVLTGLDVTGFEAGQVVYLGANGDIIGAAPQAPLHSVRLGQVVRDSPSNNGSIYVRIDNGYEIGELHDVIDSTTTSTLGDLLVKSGSVWINSKQLTGPYGVTGSFSVQTPGANGIILDTDINNDTLSSRLFFKISGSGRDVSMRNSNGSLLFGYDATAGNASGPYMMTLSSSAVSIGNNYTINATRGAILQLSGSVNIEDGFAYKQDGENVIYIQRNTGLTSGTFNNTIAGQGAAEGTAYFDQMTAVGYTALVQSSGSDQTAVGYVAGAFNTGSSQTLIGWGAGYQGKASNQTAVGEQAGWQNTGSSQTAIGIRAGQYNSGSNQTAIGADAGVRNTATQQTAVGIQAGIDNIGVAQTALGQQAGQDNSGSTQTAVGYAAGFQNSGSTQVAIGAQAGRDNKGDLQTATGYESGRLNTADNQSAHGYRAGYANTGSNQTAIGSLAGRFNSGSNQTVVGVSAGEQNIGNTQTAIGAYAGYANAGSSQTATGYEAGRLNSGIGQTATGYAAGYENTGSYQSAYGYQAGTYNSGSNQTATGFQAGVRNLGTNQTVTGHQAGYQNTGSNQTATGYQAGFNNSGSNQVAMGNSAGEGNRGNNQTAIGSQAGYLNTGSNQTTVGSSAGYQNSGSDNTNIGYQAGTYTTGVTINSQSAQSVFLGSQTTAGGGNRTNQIVIGFSASGIGDNSVVLGNSSITTTALRGAVGIGTTTPTYTLQIHAAPTASIRLQETGSGGNKRLDLTIDASGVARISANQSAQQMAFDTVGSERIRITSTGNVGINKTTPNATLDVSGSTIISGSLTVTGGITGSITASGVFGPFGANSVISASFARTASYAAFAPSTIQTSGSTIYSTNPAAGPNFNTTGSIFIGTGSGTDTTSSLLSNLVAIGTYAGYRNTKDGQTAIGSYAGYQNTGDIQTAIGTSAGNNNSGYGQTVIGHTAGSQNTGTQHTAVGNSAGQNNTGNSCTTIGAAAGQGNAGNNQTAVGFAAGYQNTGKDNTNIGYDAGRYEALGSAVNSGSFESIYIGSSTKSGGPQRQNQIVIGYDAVGLGSNSVLLGNSSITLTALRGQVGVNKTTPNAQLDVNGDTIISGSLSILGISGSGDAKIVKTAFGSYLDFEDYNSGGLTDHPIDVSYVAYKSGSDPIQALPPHSTLHVRRYSGYNGTTYVPGFEEAIQVDGSYGWNSNSTPTSWYIRLGESGSVQPNTKMSIIRAPDNLWSNAVTGITNSASGTYQHQTLFYNPVQVAGDTRIIGDLQIESNFVDDDASNSINNKALIQAGLLYLSNNF